MNRHESLERSRRSLNNLDPTSTQYPQSITEKAPNQCFPSGSIIAQDDTDANAMERTIYQLATASRQPIDLSKLVASLVKSLPTHDVTYSSSTVQSSQNFILFKLAVVLPKKTPGTERLHDTLRIWVNSHLEIGHVTSYIFKKRSHAVEVRAVAVIVDEDSARCKNCNAALLLLPFTVLSGDPSSCIEFPEEVEELLEGNFSRMVLVLDGERSNGDSCARENVLDRLVGKIGCTFQQCKVVATPNFDNAFGKCCEAIVKSYFESTLDGTQVGSHVTPSLARVSLANLGFLCLQRLIQNIDAEGCFRKCTSKGNIFCLCENTLNLMIHELHHASNESHQNMHDWPPHEFQEDGASFVSMYFEGEYSLPLNWHLPLTDLERKVFDIFNQLGEEASFAEFVEIFAQDLSQPTKKNLLTMLDNGNDFACFANVVSLFINGDVQAEAEEETVIYLPIERLLQIIEQSAEYEAPHIQEQVLVEIPSYLYQRIALAKEKENSPIGQNKNDRGPDKIVNKRKPSHGETEPERQSSGRVKRVRSNIPKFETEEQRKSKEFTSLLEALL